ncbi:MAG: hypothetical protein M3Z92_15950 [Bacteroidota bacterium]|nr:hypothetical protein [Bacteroidota bacterium]
METLERIIATFDKWAHPWTFYNFVLDNDQLDEKNKSAFREIWTRAGDYELWNFSDLLLGCKTAEQFLKKNYPLTDDTIRSIVRALSYQWK